MAPSLAAALAMTHGNLSDCAPLLLWFLFWQSLGGGLWLLLSHTTIGQGLAQALATQSSGTAALLNGEWAGRIYYTASAVLAGWHLKAFVGSRTNNTDSATVAPPPSPRKPNANAPAVVHDDLGAFRRVLDQRDGDGAWTPMMTRSSKTQTYKAWKRDPAGGGPTQYFSTTTTRGVTPMDVVRFYYDDARRLQWDDLLKSARRVDGTDPIAGTDIVYWERRFPVCSNRDYVIARRTFEIDGAYYCVTKGVSHPAHPPVAGLWRVTNFFSCWRVREVPWTGPNGGVAVETTLLHTEELGLPRALAKLAVKVGMPAFVARIEPSLRECAESHAAMTRAPAPEAEEEEDVRGFIPLNASLPSRHRKSRVVIAAGAGLAAAVVLGQSAMGAAVLATLWRHRKQQQKV